MAHGDQASGVAALTPFAEALPVVGQFLGAAARYALEADEREATRNCLADALDTSGTGARHRKRRDRFLHPIDHHAWKVALRQAAEGIMGGELLEEPQAGDGEVESSDDVSLGASAGDVVDAPQDVLAEVRQLASKELRKALAAEPPTPWTVRLSAAIAMNAEAVWERSGSDKRMEWERLILNKPDSVGLGREALDDAAFRAFGERVGIRFAAKMAAHKVLESLVERLDQQDAQRAKIELVTAVQGVRVALVAIAATAVVAAAALVDIAVR